MKRKSFILFIILSFFLFSGCWNYDDLEDLEIVLGVAIDKNLASGNYILTAEILNQYQSGGQSEGEESGTTRPGSSSLCVETTGATIFDAMRNAISKTGKKLFWGHCKGIIISEEAAKDGIIPILDIFWRDAEVRPDIWIIISHGDDAGAFLKLKIRSGELVSDFLNNTIRTDREISTFVKNEMLSFVETLSVKTSSVVAPAVYAVLENGNFIPEIKGTAVFKKDELKYFLDAEESKIALLIRNELKGGSFVLDQSSSVDAEHAMRISLEVYDSKVKIKPVLQNDRLIMEIAANLEFSVCELGGSENYLEKDLRDMLANHMTAMLESRILALVQKTKDSYSTDIFGFDQAIKSAMPDYWKANREDWDTIYKGLQIIPKVKVTLVLSANTSDTIAIN